MPHAPTKDWSRFARSLALARRSLRLALTLSVCAAAIERLQAQPPRSAALSVGSVDTLWSPTLRERRPYLLYTPPSYHLPTRVPRAYPVLYLIDGDVHFHWVTGIIEMLATGVGGTYAIPEMIVVGLPVANRRRDLTPTRIDRDPYGRPLPPGWEITGGNPDFLRFIRNELIPHVDSAFRTAPYRVLLGHSLGGLAVLNALYTTPATFNAYVAIDPTLWMDDRLMVRRARDVFGTPAPAARTLFLAQANNITPYDSGTVLNYNHILALNSIIRDGNTSGIRYGYRYYDTEDHGTVPLIAGYDALRFIFDGYATHYPKAIAQPGYLTQHFEQVSEALGYRALAPAALAEFVQQMASFAPPPASGAVADPLVRLLGTWVRDSASAAMPPGESLVLTPTRGGVRVVVRAGGPTGASLADRSCRRGADSLATVAAGARAPCVITVVGDSVHYTVSGRLGGKMVTVERGILAPSSDGQSLREDVTRYNVKGQAERRRQRYTRLY